MIKFCVKIIPKGIYTFENTLIPMLPELDKIKKKRLKLGLKQFELSKEAGISQSTLAKIEGKRRRVPSYDTAKRIFEALDRIESQDEEKAKDRMCESVAYVLQNDKISKAKKIMRENDFSQLPVIERGFGIGSITEYILAYEEYQDSDKVSKIMGGAFPVVSENTSLKAVKALLRENQAVLLQKEKKITGIINLADLSLR